MRFAEGATTLGTATAPPYTVNVTIPADAACNTVRTFSAIATDSLGQTDVGHRAGHWVPAAPAAQAPTPRPHGHGDPGAGRQDAGHVRHAAR